MSTKKIQIIGNIATKDDVVNIRSDISALEVAVDGKANQSTTLDGYGITDAYTKTDGEALAERVNNAESVIEKLNGSEDGSVRKQISDAITNANLGQYAKQSELDELNTVVADKANTADLPVNVSELNNDAQYQTATDLAPLIDRVGTLESDIGTKASASELATHMVDNTNPHEVTATQTGALPITGGTLTGILYTTASTPLLIGKNGKVGLRAATEEKDNVGQINISNAWYGNGDQWGSQISAYNGQTGKYNELRVSHDGVQYNSEDGVAHTVLHDGNIDDYTAHLASTSSVNTNVDKHNTSTSAHADIRGLIAELTVKLTNFLDVDNATVDQLSEVITLINNNKGTLESLTTTKINVSDIVNDLTTNSDSKVLSAAQGVVIKTLIDTLQTELDSHTSNKSNPHEVTKAQVGLENVPNVATNDQTPTYSAATTLATLTSGEKLSVSLGKIMKAITDFISHKGNTSNPHSVTKAQVGLGNVDNTKDADKPISTAMQAALDSKANTSAIPTKTSQLTNDSGFKTTDNNTTYSLSKSGSTITLTGSDGSTTSVTDADTNTVYTHPTSSGNKHIPSGGSSGQILRWSADGTAAWGADNNTTYSQATGSALGLVKIGYPESGKNYPVELNSSGQMYVNVPWTDNNTVYTHPGYTAKSSGLYKVTVDSTGHISAATAVTKSDITALGIPAQDTNTTYGAATSSAAGLMSASDKSKLDGIASGANAYTHPSTHPASMITDLATVATSGSYNDLSDKPSHSADMITSGTFSTTEIKAKTGTDYSVARIRNIQASTTDLTAGSSALANGDIYLVYE